YATCGADDLLHLEASCSKDFRGERRRGRFDPELKNGCLQGRTAQSRQVYMYGRQKWRSVEEGEENFEKMQVERPDTEEGHSSLCL
ncbi:unnamed protein product, partial [Polarella glacialis]